MSGIYWLASYPKSGNTWLRIVLHNFIQNCHQPTDINQISDELMAGSRLWLDQILGFDTSELDFTELERLRPAAYRWSQHSKKVSYHKIHDAYSYTDNGEPLVSNEATLGALYIMRNPLDVAISFAHHRRCSIDRAIEMMGDHDYTLSQTQEQLLPQVPQKLFSWSEHVLSWCEAPDLNCLLIRYEDMLSHPMATFTRALRFLKLPDDPERTAKAIRLSRFEGLAQQEQERGFNEKRPEVECFFRKGISGEWRNVLTPQQVSKICRDHGEVMRHFGYLGACMK